MTQKSLSQEAVREAIKLVKKYGTVMLAAQAIGIPRQTLQHRIDRATQVLSPEEITADVIADENSLITKVQLLETQLKTAKTNELEQRYVTEHIFKLSSAEANPPSWLIKTTAPKSSPGIPTLFASDWHWGEVVKKEQIGKVNEYDLAIAHSRAKALIENCIRLINTFGKCEGIVFALGGDMFSGDIHEELVATNEIEVMPCIIDLFGILVWCVNTLVDHFDKVFIPCVVGNHGRNTFKIRAKGRAHTSYDWLLYKMLEKHFEKDSRITFMVPDGADAYYRVYSHRYLLTHGDQFRGGDGMIGALGPIIRGDHKKRSRNSQIDMAYDTMIIGHWHQLIQLQRLIVNGSLVGYNEYAFVNNFPYEPPRQALWLTHPEHGITFSMPVHVERSNKVVVTNWVSI
jgi:hypothetical protein